MSVRQRFLTCLSVALLCVCASCTTSAPSDSTSFKHQDWGQRWDWGTYQMDTGDRGNTNSVTTAEVYDWCANVLSESRTMPATNRWSFSGN